MPSVTPSSKLRENAKLTGDGNRLATQAPAVAIKKEWSGSRSGIGCESPEGCSPKAREPLRQPFRESPGEPSGREPPKDNQAKTATVTSSDCEDGRVDPLVEDYACYYCECQFPTFFSLKKHMVKHNLDCPICKFQHSTGDNLKVHMEIAHPDDTPLYCRKCSRCFMNKKALGLHENGCAGKTLHRCPQCPKFYRSASWLASHIKKSHAQSTATEPPLLNSRQDLEMQPDSNPFPSQSASFLPS